MIEIVRYDPSYADQVLEIARDIHSESVYARFPMDEAKLLRQLGASDQLVTDRWFRLAVEEGRVLGAFYGVVFPTFFNAMRIAKDLGQWTRRDGTARNAWGLLVSAFEEWAREQRADVVGLGYSVPGTRIEDMRRIAEYQGFHVVGYNLLKEIQHG